MEICHHTNHNSYAFHNTELISRTEKYVYKLICNFIQNKISFSTDIEKEADATKYVFMSRCQNIGRNCKGRTKFS